MDSVKYPTTCYHSQQLKDLQILNIIDMSCIPIRLPYRLYKICIEIFKPALPNANELRKTLLENNFIYLNNKETYIFKTRRRIILFSKQGPHFIILYIYIFFFFK
jgi:hypothetical protein